jgi:predicted transcriptional regulator
MTKEQAEEERRTFTAWKLTVLDAMSVDTRLTELDFRVAFRIMQHVNGRTKLAWPSVSRLAAQLGKSEDRIRASTKRLHDLDWVRKRRHSRKAPNEYVFRDKNVAETIDKMLDRLDAIMNDDHAKMHGQDRDDHADLPVPDPVKMHGPDQADLHGKHLNQNYLQITPSYEGSEGIKVSAYARAKGKVA